MRWLALPLLVVVLAGLAYGLWPRGAEPAGEGLDAAAVATAIAELERTEAPSGTKTSRLGPIVFPQDHGAHEDAQAELWEVRADLRDESGQPIAVRLSLARLALAGETRAEEPNGGASTRLEVIAPDAGRAAEQPMQRRTSAFASRSILAGELVLMSGGRVQPAPIREQRLSRAALGLAGAGGDAAGTERVWIEQWSLLREPTGSLLLRAEAQGVELELTLSPLKPPVVLDPTTGSPDQVATPSVSFYSQSRLRVSGTLRMDSDDLALHGLGWLDHGWGAIADVLAGGRRQLVANRFQLQLEDGSEIACLHLRRRAGGGTPIPSCALIGVDGETLLLQRRDLSLVPTDAVWVADDGVAYPLGWRLLIPGRGLDLTIEPLFDDPAAARAAPSAVATDRSWRGAVSVTGWRESDAISGGGQMDLNGYGDSSPLGT